MSDFASIGKIAIVIGITLVVIGIFINYGFRIPKVGKLPGDIHIKKENFDFYFLITTCVLISILLTLLFLLIKRLK